MELDLSSSDSETDVIVPNDAAAQRRSRRAALIADRRSRGEIRNIQHQIRNNACHRRSRRAAIIAARRASGQIRIHAANDTSPPSLPPSPNPPPPTLPPPPPQPVWAVQHEIGDGACGFRAIARRFLGDPELHLQARHQIVLYLAHNSQDDNLHIHDGINTELLYCSGSPPSTYSSYDD